METLNTTSTGERRENGENWEELRREVVHDSSFLDGLFYLSVLFVILYIFCHNQAYESLNCGERPGQSVR